jgi:hypothetical protein
MMCHGFIASHISVIDNLREVRRPQEPECLMCAKFTRYSTGQGK